MIPLDPSSGPSGINRPSAGPTTETSQSDMLPRRGAFVLLEGVDRCGKTTQCARLLQRLLAAGVAATAMRFPDRTTATGVIINQYLQASDKEAPLDDHAIHLLFSANRWEAAPRLRDALHNGTTIICDRYAYSGVAFSSAKVDAQTGAPVLDVPWCQAPDRGLPAPDCVIFLDLSVDEAEQRGGFGGERYETRDMQLRVRERFYALAKLDEGRVPWTMVNAAQTIEQVEDEIWGIVRQTMETCVEQPVGTMWPDSDK